MADELDPRLEAVLRTAIRADADAVPFTLRAATLEARLAMRDRTRRRRRTVLVAAAVLVAVGTSLGAVALVRFDGPMGQSPSPSAEASPSDVPATPGAATTVLRSYEELERLPSAPTSVLVRGEGSGGTTVVGEIAGAVDLRAAVACSSGEIRIQHGPDASTSNETAVACRPDGVTVSISAQEMGSPVNRIAVVAPAGVAWRLVAGTGELALPTLAPEACARVASPGQVRTVELRDTFTDTSKDVGVITWSGTGDPPETAATWDPTGGIGEFGAYRAVSTFQLDANAFCLAGWRIEYAPATSVEAARAAGTAPSDVTVAVAGTASQPVHTVDFDLPDRGHYVVRAVLDWRLEDGMLGRDVRLWRIWSDAAEFYPEIPHPDPTVPCGTPDLAASAPPAVSMDLDGSSVATGVHMGGRWDGTPAPGASSVPSDTIHLSTGSGHGLRIAGDVCAMLWGVTYGPVPAARDSFEATGEPLAIQGNPGFDPTYARENRIALDKLPPGEWIVQADLVFPDGSSRTWFRVSVSE